MMGTTMDQLTMKETKQIRELLDKSKVRMGPYISKLAEELLTKLRVHSENKIKGRGNV